MTTLLLKLFVKNYEKTNDPSVREACGKLGGVVGIVSNLLLCTMKIAVGMISNSIAIISDGINNLADASSSIITLIGFKLASMPEDEDHPYGHARIEYLAGLAVSVMIIVVGVELLKTSIDKVMNPEAMDYSIATFVVLIIAIAIKVWQSMFNISLGKRINSAALIATGTDSRNDVISTTVVLISLVVGKLSGLLIDGYMGCLVALFIIWSGIGLVRETISPLLGEAPDQELVNQIAEMAESYDGVLGIHDLIVHNYGPGKIFASIHIEVDSRVDVMKSHDMIDNIERDIAHKLHIHITAHLDPIDTQNPELQKIKEALEKYVDSVEGLHNMHDLRIVPGETHSNIIFDIVVSPECKVDRKEISNGARNAVRTINPKYFVVINFDQAYLSMS